MLILEEIRCKECGRKLMELYGQAQVKCPKCKSMVFANIADTKREVYIKPERQKQSASYRVNLDSWRFFILRQRSRKSQTGREAYNRKICGREALNRKRRKEI